MFISQLPDDVDEVELAILFMRVGVVVGARRDMSKSIAWLEFDTPQQAVDALRHKNAVRGGIVSVTFRKSPRIK